MSDEPIFGDLIFNRAEHGWATELGTIMCHMRAVVDAPGHPHCRSIELRDWLAEEQEHFNRLLEAHQLDYVMKSPRIDASFLDRDYQDMDFFATLSRKLEMLGAMNAVSFLLGMAWFCLQDFGHSGYPIPQHALVHVSRWSQSGGASFQFEKCLLRIHKVIGAGEVDLRRLEGALRKDPLKSRRDLNALLERLTAPKMEATVKAPPKTNLIINSGQPPPKLILFASAGPWNTDFIDISRERKRLLAIVDTYPDKFILQDIPACEIRDLVRKLRKANPDILHIAGHGSCEYLVLEYAEGNARRVLTKKLVELLKLAAVEGNLQGVILNACYSATYVEEIADVVGFAIGTHGALDDRAAITFTEVLYEGMAEGRSLKEAFLWAKFSGGLETEDDFEPIHRERRSPEEIATAMRALQFANAQTQENSGSPVPS